MWPHITQLILKSILLICSSNSRYLLVLCKSCIENDTPRKSPHRRTHSSCTLKYILLCLFRLINSLDMSDNLKIPVLCMSCKLYRINDILYYLVVLKRFKEIIIPFSMIGKTKKFYTFECIFRTASYALFVEIEILFFTFRTIVFIFTSLTLRLARITDIIAVSVVKRRTTVQTRKSMRI